MSQTKQNTIEIMNELIPILCPDEQEVFELYSDALYDQAISQDNNKMGDGSYFGEAIGLDSNALITIVVTLLLEGALREAGKNSWKKLHSAYLKHKKHFKDVEPEAAQALETALEDKAKAETEALKATDTGKIKQ